jgi:GPH family glycoside/pentoside/hexuronide:cation symporter
VFETDESSERTGTGGRVVPLRPAVSGAPRAGDPAARVPLARKVSYGVGELPIGIRMSAFGFVLFPFYTDGALLPPALVGAAIAIGRVWDGLNDPLMGWLSDRTRTRFGRRRPYVGAMILPLAAGFAAIWLPPSGLSSMETFAYLVVSLCLFDVFYGFYATPYLALGAEMTTDYAERARVVATRAVVHNAGLLLGGGGFVAIATALGGDHGAYGQAGTVLAAIMLVGGVVAFFGTREPAIAAETTPASFRSLVADLRSTLHLHSFRALVLASAVLLVGSSMSQALSLYVFRDAFGAVERAGMVILVYLLSATLAFPAWAAAAARIGKMGALRICLLWSAVSHCVAIFIEPSWPFAATLALIALAGAGAGGYILPVAIAADIFDEDELATGRRREGAFFGVWTLVMKLAAAVGIAVVGIVLPSLGYQAGLERQSPETLWALKLAWGPGIAVFFVLTFLLLRRFPLTMERHQAIQAALKARR